MKNLPAWKSVHCESQAALPSPSLWYISALSRFSMVSKAKPAFVYLTVSNVGNAITGNKGRIWQKQLRIWTLCHCACTCRHIRQLDKTLGMLSRGILQLGGSTIEVHAANGSKNQVPQLGTQNTKTKKQKAQAHILSKNPPEKAANLSMPSI